VRDVVPNAAAVAVAGVAVLAGVVTVTVGNATAGVLDAGGGAADVCSTRVSALVVSLYTDAPAPLWLSHFAVTSARQAALAVAAVRRVALAVPA
jgi:hypothetical protein